MLDLTHEESSPSILRAYVESGRWTDQTVSAEFPLTIITLIAEEALRLQVPSHEIVIRITGGSIPRVIELRRLAGIDDEGPTANLTPAVR